LPPPAVSAILKLAFNKRSCTMAVFKKITLLSGFALIALSTTALCARTDSYRVRPTSKMVMGFRTRDSATVKRIMPRLARKAAVEKRFVARRKMTKFTPMLRKQISFRARPATKSLAEATKTRANFAYLMKPPAKVPLNQLKSLQLVADEMPATDNAGEESAVE
jgi:hypothetical protein